jgi:hypothetical protein
MVERYYILLCRVYKIIRDKLQNNTSVKLVLQIIIKVVNNLAGPDNIIPILLVFGAYFQIIDDSGFLFSITKKTKTIRMTTKEIQRFYTKHQVKDIFVIRNNLNIYLMLDLLI